MWHSIFNVLGVIGAAIIVVAYFFNQQGWMKSDGWRYALVNLVGSSLILISLAVDWNLASVVIEGFWAAISIFGLLKVLRKPRLTLRP